MPKRAPRETHSRLPPAIMRRSRELRHPLTPAEKKVWNGIRDHQLGTHIRRQHVLLGHFIADFYCAQARLCIAVDGDRHATSDQAEYDSARTAELEADNYRVLRFGNAEVLANLPTVLEAIRDACFTAQGGKGSRG